ncbi:MAG TPA: cytochrome P450 [Gemmataceae bacterium]|jgi:cytochrome P450
MATATLRPPGPKGHLLLGNLPEFRRDMLSFVTDCTRTYGDVVAFRLGPRRCLLINHPDLIEEVLVTNARNFIKHFVLRMKPSLLGKGLLTSNGDFWLRQRRLAQPAFHRDRINAYGAVMVSYTERMLAGWKDGEAHDIHADMMQLTLEIVAKTLFDADVSGKGQAVGEALQTALHFFSTRFKSLFRLPGFAPTPANLRLKKAIRRLDDIIFRMVDERRGSGEDRGDLLSMLLHAQDQDDGSRMTNRQLRDEMMTLFLAGHETTAISLAWTWYLLARHPDVGAKLVQELKQELGERSPTVADLPRLRYTESIVLESMRLYPPAYMFGREPIETCALGGFEVAAGRTVFMSQWVTQRDPRFFDHAAEFLPERWRSDKIKSLPKYAYFPFGGGPRICIGNNFAMMEAILILATMARHWQFTLAPGHPVILEPLMTLRPMHGIKGIIHRR